MLSSSSSNGFGNENKMIFARDDLKIAIAHKISSDISNALTNSAMNSNFECFFILFYLHQLFALRPRTVLVFGLYKNSRNDGCGGMKCAVLKCSNASIVSAP